VELLLAAIHVAVVEFDHHLARLALFDVDVAEAA
jgi:hypothetical protein